MCSSNCVGDLQSAITAYMNGLHGTHANASACDAAMDVNGIPLTNMLFDFVCLKARDIGHGGCEPGVASTHRRGLLQKCLGLGAGVSVPVVAM